MAKSFALFLNIARAVRRLRPAISDAVIAIEEALPEKGNGKAKLEAVRQMVSAVWDKAESLAVSLEDAWPAISALITALVTLYNVKGWPKSLD